jgi:hypothetical protein
MFRRIVTLLLAGCLSLEATVAFAADAPTLFSRSSASVNIERSGDENPVKEIAKSVYWGAIAGGLLGGAVALADSGPSMEPLRWGIVLGAFGGLAFGTYFVTVRPQPTSLLELRDGWLVPDAAALVAFEPVPGGVRVHAIGVRF